MDLNYLKTAEHMKEIMVRPNPFVLEATKTYLSRQEIRSSNFGADFLKVYMEIEAQMYARIQNKQQEDEANYQKSSIL